MTDSRKILGKAGELRAAEMLEAGGWVVLDRNFRTEAGELDLVALDGEQLVFVEVKARRLGSRRGPERAVMAVDRRKQGRLRRMAAVWLGQAERPSRHFTEIRFDVVGLTFDRDGMICQTEHLRGAF